MKKTALLITLLFSIQANSFWGNKSKESSLITEECVVGEDKNNNDKNYCKKSVNDKSTCYERSGNSSIQVTCEFYEELKKESYKSK